jgi:hypothetical protein
VSGDFISTLRILSLRSFPVEMPMNIGPVLSGYGATDIWNARWFKLHKTRLQMYYSVTGHPEFQSIRDGVTKWAVPWPMDWSWWSAKLATAVTGPHSPSYMRNCIIEFSMLQDARMTLMILLRFRSSRISSIDSSVTAENRTLWTWYFWSGMTSGIRS